jgi:ribosomal protein L17
MSGVGKSTAAFAVAHRYDLWLYPVDARTYAHAEAMDAPGLRLTADELWLDRTPEQMADDFEAEARERHALILADVGEIPDDGAPVLVEGPQLLPELVEGPALFFAASSELQRELVAARGSLTYSSTRDPERALANRVRRDELLAQRLRERADVVEIGSVRDAEPALDAFARKHVEAWITLADHGDVANRRRVENERRLDQWRRYAAHEPRARAGTVNLACECNRSGCMQTVPVPFGGTQPFLAH